MKKLLILITSLVVIIGCSCSASAGYVDTQQDILKNVWRGFYGYGTQEVFVDTDTGVMYATFYGNRAISTVVMVNPDGTPRIWDGEI